MKYNKTKRGLEIAGGIVGVVGSSCEIIYCLYMLIYINNISYIFTKESYIALMSLGIILILFGAISIYSFTRLIKSPITESGKIIERKPDRICCIVISILTGQIVATGLIIAVLCLKDFNEEQNSSKTNMNINNSIDSKIASLKNLKGSGVLDEESYKKAIEKIKKEIE